VKACFVPLAHYDHPAWTVTDEEADRARPQMQKFLQAVVDRYAPQFLARFAVRHGELFDLGVAMASLYYLKWRVVAALKEEEDRKRAAELHRTISIDRSAGTAPAEGPEPVLCEQCGGTFPNREELAKHLPCKGSPN
jgi:hypothetical protein